MKKICTKILADHTGQPLDRIGELDCYVRLATL